jgi:hypothetical protein
LTIIVRSCPDDPMFVEVDTMPRFVLAVETNQEFGFEDVQFALVEIGSDEARRLVARCELAERLKEADDALFVVEYWWGGPTYFSEDQVPEGTDRPTAGEHLRVSDDFGFSERTEEDRARGHHPVRTDLDRVRVGPGRDGGSGTFVEFVAHVEDTDCEITSCGLPLTLLREIAERETT